MMNEKNECPKCNGKMVQGAVLDFAGGGYQVGHRHNGLPEKSFWTGIKMPVEERLPIGAFCFQKCGFLEFYTDSKFAVK